MVYHKLTGYSFPLVDVCKKLGIWRDPIEFNDEADLMIQAIRCLKRAVFDNPLIFECKKCKSEMNKYQLKKEIFPGEDSFR